jgi:hypothetical protein
MQTLYFSEPPTSGEHGCAISTVQGGLPEWLAHAPPSMCVTWHSVQLDVHVVDCKNVKPRCGAGGDRKRACWACSGSILGMGSGVSAPLPPQKERFWEAF